MISSLRFSLFVVSLLVAVASGFMPMSSKPAASARVLGSPLAMAGPSVLERETVRTAGPAVLDRPQVEERSRAPSKDRQQQGNEAWEVRIYNDGLNTREHVARSLVQVTGMTELVAYQTMMQAHQNGIAVVGRWVFEVAEMYHDELKRNGIVCDLIPVDDES